MDKKLGLGLNLQSLSNRLRNVRGRRSVLPLLALVLILSPAVYADSTIPAGKINSALECEAESVAVDKPYTTIASSDLSVLSSAKLASKPDENNSCELVAKHAIKLQNNGNLTLIDTRKNKEYKSYRIPGSLNFLPNIIKTKAYLKNTPIALLSRDPMLDDLYALCRSLRKSGFQKVRVVKGGLPAWIKSRGSIVGIPENNVGLRTISPQQLFQLKRTNIIAVDATRGKREIISVATGSVTTIKYGSDPNKVAARIVRVLRKQRADYIVMVADNARNRARYDHLKKALEKKGLQNFYYLDSSLGKYRQTANKQKAIWKYVANKPKYISSCARQS